MALTAAPVTGRTARADIVGRLLILSLVAVLASVVLASATAPVTEAPPRFPADDSVFAVDGWTVSQADLGGRPGVVFVGRDYVSVDGVHASLSITSSPQAKSVYRAGADVPFLGGGYRIDAAPSNEVAPTPGRETLIARRGGEAWLQIASFGERRGVFGNGPVAWSLAVSDLILGHPNDYYLVRVLIPYDEPNVARGVQLAETLIPRLAAWYRA